MAKEPAIEPALSAEEWAVVLSGAPFVRPQHSTPELEDEYQIGPGWIEASFCGDSAPMPATIALALANAALPDSDPRKITRDKLAALESIIESAYERTLDHEPASRAFLAALASYLPPE